MRKDGAANADIAAYWVRAAIFAMAPDASRPAESMNRLNTFAHSKAAHSKAAHSKAGTVSALIRCCRAERSMRSKGKATRLMKVISRKSFE